MTKDGEVVTKHATLRFNPPTAFGMHASAIARVKYLVDALRPFDNNSTRSRTEAQLRRVRAAVADAERMDDDEAKVELSKGEGSSPREGQGSHPALPWPLRWSRDRANCPDRAEKTRKFASFASWLIAEMGVGCVAHEPRSSMGSDACGVRRFR